MNKNNKSGRSFSFKLNSEQKEIKEAYYQTCDGDKTQKKYPFMFINGESGSGKTASCLQISLDSLMKGEISNIYIVRSMISQEELGYLKGDADEKTASYHLYLREMMYKMLPSQSDKKNIEKRIEKGEISYVPIAFLRGITLDDCCVIIEEYQNLKESVLSLIIGRAGKNCTMFFTGDKYQIDLPRRQDSCVFSAERIKDDQSVYYKVLLENHRNPNIRRIIAKIERRTTEMTNNQKIIFQKWEESEGDYDVVLNYVKEHFEISLAEASLLLTQNGYTE